MLLIFFNGEQEYVYAVKLFFTYFYFVYSVQLLFIKSGVE